MRSILVACGLVGGAGMIPPGQDTPVHFRADTDVSATVVYRMQGVWSAVGFTGAEDSTAGEFETHVRQSRRALVDALDPRIIHVRFDSSMARYRPGDDYPWRMVPTPMGSSDPVAVRRDHLLTWSYLEAPHAEVRRVMGLRGQPEFAVRDSVMGAGERWTGLVQLPYTMAFPDAVGSTVSVRLSGRATFVLDSVVPRSADTLAYVQAQAGLTPTTIDGAILLGDQRRPVTVWGTVSTSMVWSTGWSEWVTGRTTIRMQHRVDPGEDSTDEVTLFADLVSRFSVQP